MIHIGFGNVYQSGEMCEPDMNPPEYEDEEESKNDDDWH